MFPEAPSSGMMVVTVTQKTQSDMTSWSAKVEQEREQMLDKVSCFLAFVIRSSDAFLSDSQYCVWLDCSAR